MTNRIQRTERDGQTFIKMVIIGLTLVALPIIVVYPSFATLTTTTIHPFIITEDTSGTNAILNLTAPASDRPRTLRQIMVVCSGAATITVTSNIDRVITSGTEVILLPDVDLTATTSGALFVVIELLPTDVVDVTVPAVAAETCSVIVLEEIR